MSAASRRKGAEGEREAAGVLRDAGLPADRLVQQAGLYVRGDLTGLPGYHFEVKRQETLRLPTWLRQAVAEAPIGAVPVVAFRQNRGAWYACLPLEDLARLIREADPATAGYRVLGALEGAE